MTNIFDLANRPVARKALEPLLAARALFFAGRRYTCPCCGWRLRAFTRGGRSLRARERGYCPRCNAKARHRRIWLFLEQKTSLFTTGLYVLDVSPKYSFSRRFANMPSLHYVGIDLGNRFNVSAKMDLTAAALRSDSFDAILCVHVLEHVPDDRAAMKELYRVLKPGGWALVSVPIRLNEVTSEDPTVKTPQERKRVFGEDDHVRFYGRDLADRLASCGFRVQLDLGSDIEPQAMEEYGLRDDENIFYCVKGQ